jgi:cyclic pyranopterin monophosphate synthase
VARQRPIHEKPIVYRRAVARGELTLGVGSRRAIARGRVEKGDPIAAAEIAGLSAMKRTPELLPHCHTIPISGARVDVGRTRTGVRAEVEVEALYRTGVEMEALVGVTIALLTVWDMVKYLEKDASGGYPTTRLGPIRVVAKQKRPAPGGAA